MRTPTIIACSSAGSRRECPTARTPIRKSSASKCSRSSARWRSTATRSFIADADPAKRDKLIDTLLASPEYADYFANKWSALLRNKRVKPADARGNFAFHEWIREAMQANKPYDQFVREVVAASGEIE